MATLPIAALVHRLLEKHQPACIVHFAAESHVDRSIRGPDDFIRTNVDGTFALLEETRAYWTALAEAQRRRFRFLHVSTDEVYGSLGPDDPPFSETTRYAPNSPYAASKAASDHLVRAYHHTYGLPVLTTQLFEQLRTLSVSREAHSSDDPQRARRQAAARLRRRQETSATGSMSRITAAIATVLRAARPGDLQHRRVE